MGKLTGRARFGNALLALAMLAALTAAGAGGETTSSGGLVYVDREFTVGPQSQNPRALIAPCPSRRHVIGGGAFVDAQFDEAELNASFPVDRRDAGAVPDDGWGVYVDNYSPLARRVVVKAICARENPVYKSARFGLPAESVAWANPKCPRGTNVYSGGATNNAPYRRVNLSETFPLDLGDAGARPEDAWRTEFWNFSTEPASATAYAICGRRSPAYRRSTASAGPNDDTLWDLLCPTQRHHVGGGGVSHNSVAGMTVRTSMPVDTDGKIDAAPDDEWEVRVDNFNAGARTIAVHAVCLR